MISLIGTGNAAWSLATALHKAGVIIDSIYARSMSAAGDLADVVNASAKPISAIPESTSKVLILAVSDTAVAELASSINAPSGSILTHVSGPTHMDVLANHSGAYGVFYPLQTMVKGVNIDFTHVPFLIEGSDAETVSTLSELAAQLSDDVRPFSSEQRLALHAVAVWSNNFVNHINAESERISSKYSVPLDLLKPLVEKTAHTALEGKAKTSQTGPAMRGDTDTMNKHLELLDDEQQKIYKLLSESIQLRK